MAVSASLVSLPLTVSLVLTVSALVLAAPDGMGKSLHRLPRFIPSSSRSPFANLLASRASFLSTGHLPSSSMGSTSTAIDMGRPKRALFDDSCKGVYDRELFGKLDRVCEDCYNLYRKASVSYECRSDCYGNLMFENCLYDLMLHDMVDKYAEMVQIVGKK